MAIPEAVRKQGEASDKLMEQIRAGAGDHANPPPTPPAPPAVTPPAPPAPAATTVSKADYDVLEQRFRVLQGKYNAEVPRAAEDLKKARKDIEDLKKELEAAKKLAAPPAPPPPDFDFDKMADLHGEDVANLMKRQHEEAARLRNDLSTATDKLRDLEGRVEQIVTGELTPEEKQAAAAEAAFFAAVDDKANGIGDWRATNKDPDFHLYLEGVDEMSGRTRQELLTEARQNLRAKQVITIFTAYKNSKGAGPTPPSPEPQPGGAGAPPGEPKKWKASEVKAFYDDQARGKYKGRPDEAVRIEKEIMAAQQAGTIIRDV